MANNRFQAKRTSTAGRTPNTTNVANLQYIAAGEFGLNMADQILYTSDGTNLITVGANLTTLRITSGMALDNDKRINFRTKNTASQAMMVQQVDDNFVFYSTNTTYQPRPVWSIYANSDTSNLAFSVPVVFNTNVYIGTATLIANGSPGTAGQVLTSNGTATYWTAAGAATVNVDAQYTWTNNHTFNANVSYGNNIGLATTKGVYFNLITDANWRIGRNTGGTTKFFYTGNTLDVIAANSALEGIAFGYTGAAYLETGYAGTFTQNPLYVGNTTQNVYTTNTTIKIQANTTVNATLTAALVQVSNSTSTANLSALDLKIGATTVVNATQVTATLHVGNVSGSYANITGQVNTATLYATTSANIAAAVQANATGVYTTGTVNATTHSSGTGFTANSTVVNAVSYYSGTLLVANTTVVNATHLGGTAAASYALLASPTFTGTPSAPSAAGYTDNTQIATTAQVYDTVTTVPENAQTVTAYTLALTDSGKMVSLSNTSAVTLTVPNNSTIAFATATRVDLLQYNTGQVTVAAGTGVTLRSSSSKLKLTGQYSGATLWKKGTDEWVLIGDITA